MKISKTIPELYNSAIRTVTVVFGSLFNNITVKTYNPDGSINTNKRKIEISFSNRSQYGLWLENKMRRPDDGTKIGIRLPRLSYELTGFSPDPQRQLNPLLYKSSEIMTDNDYIFPFSKKEKSPAAYEFNFTLTLWSNDMDTSVEVLEQILPYFKPEVSVKVIEQKDLPIANDITIMFKGINKQDNYTDGFEENRFIQWDMNFSVYSNIWTPVEQGEIIREIKIDLNDYNKFNNI